MAACLQTPLIPHRQALFLGDERAQLCSAWPGRGPQGVICLRRTGRALLIACSSHAGPHLSHVRLLLDLGRWRGDVSTLRRAHPWLDQQQRTQAAACDPAESRRYERRTREPRSNCKIRSIYFVCCRLYSQPCQPRSSSSGCLWVASAAARPADVTAQRPATTES